MNKEKKQNTKDLPVYSDPEITEIEELDIGGYVELATRGEKKRRKPE